MAWTNPPPGRPLFSQATKRQTLARDQLCVSCGEAPSTQVDHIHPVFLGGTAHPSNAQGMCSACHFIKSRREAALAKRMKKVKTKRTNIQDHCGIEQG